mmetsp:Transcript_46816/g.85730  ORF Transcript_46816/g.85730 Transcript_46816/m.85730 type:complete len:374 (+) Transcript_46816:71-1192(+)
MSASDVNNMDFLGAFMAEDVEPCGLAGDFYREPDDIVRNIPMEWLAEPEFALTGEPYLESKFAAFPLPPDCGQCAKWQAVDGERGSTSWRRFARADVAPRVPSTPFFRLEQTTVTVPTQTPCEVANAVLDILASCTTASILKVSYVKYTVTSEVFPEATCGHMCTLKVRLYDVQDAGCAVEFQRRSGDSFAFYAAYGEACRLLTQKFPGASYPACQVSWPVAPDACALVPDEDFPLADEEFRTGLGMALETEEALQTGLAPLLDLALCASPDLQAEAAVGLMDVMSRSDHLELTPETIDAIENLLKSDTAAVAYPTLKLLEGLVQTDKARQLLNRRDGLVQNIQHMACSSGAGSLVQHHAQQVLSSLPLGCAC